jgi:hypothetical protein
VPLTQKPMLIGMNNPVSQDDGHQLYPYPPGCTGHRLYEMLRERLPSITRRQYLDTFERRNLVTGREWSRTLGRDEANRIVAEMWGSGRVIVLLGREVQAAFAVPPLLLHPQVIGGATWRQLPHPSGRNMWYNAPENRRLAGLLLEELYEDYHREDTSGAVSGGAGV